MAVACGARSWKMAVMTRSQLAWKLSRMGRLIAVPGIPILLLIWLIGIIVLAIAANMTDVSDVWFMFAGTWVTVYFATAIASIVSHYWIPRLTSPEEHVMADLFVTGYTGGLGVAVYTAMFIGVSPPVWLIVLGAALLVLSLGAYLDFLIRGYLATRGDKDRIEAEKRALFDDDQ